MKYLLIIMGTLSFSVGLLDIGINYKLSLYESYFTFKTVQQSWGSYLPSRSYLNANFPYFIGDAFGWARHQISFVFFGGLGTICFILSSFFQKSKI